MSDDKTTDFGYERVPVQEKARRVGQVFHSVAGRYDLMNDLMSMGIHRAWKRFTVEVAGARPGWKVLDLAGGTGDLAAKFARITGPRGQVVLSDINASMLTQGRARLVDEGLVENLDFVQADAEHLPFADDHFDLITIAFGLRNVTDKNAALAAMHRVLKPGGKLLVLEFSHPVSRTFGKVYDLYSFKALPLMGQLVAGDADSYRYLAESIRMHPDQETLKDMMETAGFERCDYFNLTGGVVALHRGYKL
ncbi:bifunctional demethylmenaquinone methyltransferase/2-methoxy-6-polyprenyl-1,4-benzoquinol methylase UbiE [Ectothiorhodospira mobilis]|uniref:bifunctional demethylmenaquinone methyltransferase/2-methoxy-6-polyprenyl-1,4-benzoquinol methylase UbiE n=1 Tax=Ectothiorhodospira mobilis TaxID=195064 RepID=UPI001EE85F42|nr:bifunctional demethylmenaquinone methyltransferase/2-methoxy-6-polyprenyl-1,4-benzoquinol methylase UbiE [Ectothiorhodospira mobilis]MCG5536024.1 bifunctional demethylmenaquinone methyltransferase/2-methoxy-6-polyprenyl-1,4-benzoquinol methylase UbiE [Ectothiorhodospira mobilis]